MEFFFMFIGLGFFLFVMWMILSSEQKTYDRTLNERREFGYQARKDKDRKHFEKDNM